MKPQIFSFNKLQKNDFDQFINKYKNFKLYDLYKNFIIEKYLVETPVAYFSPDKKEKGQEFYQKHIKNKAEFTLGKWHVFDWRKEVYHLPGQTDLLRLRTVRNRGVISWQEQETIYNKKIALVGLSVGSSLLMSFVRSGIGNYFKIADFDTVDPHNMNRANYYLRDTGVEKIKLVVDQMYSVDPYLKIDMWPKAIDESNMKVFLKDVDLLVDCFDAFKVKFELKKVAKKLKIPILSGFNIDRGVMIITERYDLDDKLNLDFYLNGYSEENVLRPVKVPKEKTDLFVNIIGRKNHSQAMLKAAYQVGQSLTGYPQLMIATSGITATWTIEAINIFLGKSKASFRKYLDFEKLIYSDS